MSAVSDAIAARLVIANWRETTARDMLRQLASLSTDDQHGFWEDIRELMRLYVELPEEQLDMNTREDYDWCLSSLWREVELGAGRGGAW